MKDIFSIVEIIFKAVHIGDILKFLFFYLYFLVKIFMVEVGAI
jgi:hypothetical protein